MGWKAERDGEREGCEAEWTMGWKAARDGEWEWPARLGPHSGIGFKPNNDFSCGGLLDTAVAKLKANNAAGSDPGVNSFITFNVLACTSANDCKMPWSPLDLACMAMLAS